MARSRKLIFSSKLSALALAGLMSAASLAYADDYSDVDRLFGAGQVTEAMQRADQYLAANPRDARMRFLKGLMFSEQGKATEAIAVFTKLTEDFPELPEPYNNLAVLYSKQGQFDQARKSLEAAIRTNPSYATAYENLGDVYAKLASQAYSRALQIEGNSSKVSPKLAMIRELFSPKTVAATAPAPKVAPAAPSPASVVVAAAPKAPPAAPPAVVPAAPVQSSSASKPAASSAPTPAPSSTAGAASQDVQNAVNAWANAWARKDLRNYFAAYTPEFGGGKARKAWEQERRARIMGKRNITVSLSNIDVKVQGDRAVAQFQQEYAADALKASSLKTLELVRVGGRWLIYKESASS